MYCRFSEDADKRNSPSLFGLVTTTSSTKLFYSIIFLLEASNFGIRKGRLSPRVELWFAFFPQNMLEFCSKILIIIFCYFATKIDIAGSASQLNCFENWKTFSKVCLFSVFLASNALYKFLNLTFL